jgi:hypothetical protein
MARPMSCPRSIRRPQWKWRVESPPRWLSRQPSECVARIAARIYLPRMCAWACEVSARIFSPWERSIRNSMYNVSTPFFLWQIICLTIKAFRPRLAALKNLSTGRLYVVHSSVLSVRFSQNMRETGGANRTSPSTLVKSALETHSRVSPLKRPRTREFRAVQKSSRPCGNSSTWGIEWRGERTALEFERFSTMQVVADQSVTATTIRADLCANIRLIGTEPIDLAGHIAVARPGEKMSKHRVSAGDIAALLARFSELRRKACAQTGKSFPIIVIQEAGLDGFWIHRVLLSEGIESHVVDAASIATSRRWRRAKTDRIDGETLLRAASRAACPQAR